VPEPYSHCHACGESYYSYELTWPRVCRSHACNQVTYRRLDPVSVVLQPVRGDDGRLGILLGERAIAPRIGEWALPGGFVETTETAEEAGPREVVEETGLVASGTIFTRHTRNTQHGQLLIFVETTAELTMADVAGWTPSFECSGVKVAFEPEELAFPHHTNALAEWFERQEKKAELVHELTLIIGGEWFSDTVNGRHILDNYPGQHKTYRSNARIKAEKIADLFRRN